MKTLSSIADLSALGGPLNLAIGVFDGVHRGHAAVVGSAVGAAGTAVVVTFDPHPAQFFRPEAAPKPLMGGGHQGALLGGLGVSAVLPVKFDGERAAQEACDFVRELVAAGEIASVSVGAGFRFGKGRGGDVALLAELGRELGFVAHGIEAICDDGGEVISSTRVRAAVAQGDLEMVAALLGRRYSIRGRVAKGRQLGRTIGFPTANLPELPAALPPFGVYAVSVGRRQGVANIGLRPTVEGDRPAPLLEVHLFEFDEDIYGEEIEVEFHSFVRPEMKFDGIEALKAQIAADVAEVRERR